MEFFDICDTEGQPCGGIVERKEAHSKGIRHRTAHVWIIRRHAGSLQLLLQKRSMCKDSFPGQWDTSSAGHIPAGCEPKESALRELAEELGIHALPDELQPIGHFDITYEKQFHGAWFRDNEYANVFVYDKPVDAAALSLQAEEVEAVDWFDLETVEKAKREHEGWCCVPAESLVVLRVAVL